MFPEKIDDQGTAGKLFVTAGLGGMSGAQPKAGNIAGVVSVTAEVNPAATIQKDMSAGLGRRSNFRSG